MGRLFTRVSNRFSCSKGQTFTFRASVRWQHKNTMFARWIKLLVILYPALCSAQWNTSQALAPFKNNCLGGSGVPQKANLVFQADLTNSVSGQVCVNCTATFTRAGAVNYYDSATTIASAGSGIPALPAFSIAQNGTVGGIQIAGARKNWILQSEAPATTWTLVSTPTVTNSVGTFLGTVAFGTIVSTAGSQGIKQDSGVTAVSKTANCSAFMSVASGTLAVTLQIGGTGGTPENTTVVSSVNTTPTRYLVRKAFDGSATGNINCQFTNNAAGTLRIGGMMLDIETDGTNGSSWTSPSPYIKTTTTVATSVADSLTYAESNIASAETKGSASFWLSLPVTSSTGNGNPNGAFAFNAAANFTTGIGLEFAVEPNAVFGVFGGIETSFGAVPTFATNKWTHWGYTWDASTPASTVLKLYKSGIKTGNTITAASTPGSGSGLTIGGIITPSRNRFIDGQIAKFKVWNVVLSDSDMLAVDNAEQPFFP